MHRIDHVTADPNKNGPGLKGWTEGTPPLIPPTRGTEAWFNDIQENVARAITGAGITLVKGTFTQLYDAIVALVASGTTGKVSGPNSATDNAIARFDGTGGKIVQNSLVSIDDSGNLVVTGDLNFAGTKTIPIFLSPANLQGDIVYSSQTGESSIPVNTGRGYLSLDFLPHGTKVTDVEVLVKPGIARASNNMNVGVYVKTVDFATPSVSAADAVGVPDFDDNTNSLQVLAAVFSSVTIDKTSSTFYYVRVTAGNDSATNVDRVYGIRLVVEITGLRSL